MSTHPVAILFGFIGVCFLAAASGGIFRPDDWHARLAKPWWAPPGWLFAPAWSILYMTIALSGWLVWRQAGFAAVVPFSVYGISLLFNAAWSGLFFGLHRPDLAFVDIVLLWLSIAATIVVFAPIAPAAAWLLVPYLCWVSFAGALNFRIWRMNRPSARLAVERS